MICETTCSLSLPSQPCCSFQNIQFSPPDHERWSYCQHTSPELWITMCVTTVTLQLQDSMCWILQLQDQVKMHFRSQLMGFTHAQVGGLPCKQQLAKPQYFHHLHSDKHRVLQEADRQWSTGFHSTREFGIQDWAELGTKHNAIVIMKCLLLLGKHGSLPNSGLDYIFTS